MVKLDKSKCNKPDCDCDGVDEVGWHVNLIKMDMDKMSDEELRGMAENVFKGD